MMRLLFSLGKAWAGILGFSIFGGQSRLYFRTRIRGGGSRRHFLFHGLVAV